MLFRGIVLSLSLFIFSPSHAFTNAQTGKSESPKDVKNKSWILVKKGCKSCAAVLKTVETICEGQKPPVSQLGFFGIGPKKDLDKKLVSFNTYETYYGSKNEFEQSYGFNGAPGFKPRGENSKVVVGKAQVLSAIKKDAAFCGATKTTAKKETSPTPKMKPTQAKKTPTPKVKPTQVAQPVTPAPSPEPASSQTK